MMASAENVVHSQPLNAFNLALHSALFFHIHIHYVICLGVHFLLCINEWGVFCAQLAKSTTSPQKVALNKAIK